VPGNWPAWFGPEAAGKGPATRQAPRQRPTGVAAPPDRADRPDRAHQPLRPDPDGIRVAVFYTKLHNRLLRPLLAADQPQAPRELRAALRAIDQHVNAYITRARISQAA